MPTSQEYVTRIEQLDWVGLHTLWDEIVKGRTDGWDSGKAFEHLVLRAFALDDADVRWPYHVKLPSGVDEQIDGAVHFQGFSCLVESKDTKDSIDINPIAKMRNQLMRRPAGVLGLIFSRSGFTPPAIALAHHLSPQTILLWPGTEVEHVLNEKAICRFLVEKYRESVEQGVPDWSISPDSSPRTLK
jgi:hypothetical protein